MLNKITQYSFLVLGLIAGGLTGMAYEQRVMQQEALQRDLAHYNTRTGVWEWGMVVEGIKLEALPMEQMKPKVKK